MALVLHTTQGDLVVLLYYRECPKAAFNFLALCGSGYYDGCVVYRHIPGVLLQLGDPTNTGKGGESIYAKVPASGGDEDTTGRATAAGTSSAAVRLESMQPGRYFDDEGFGVTTHGQRGTLSMAHKGSKPNTNASQFFILCSPQASFDGVFTAFGVVDLQGGYEDGKGGRLTSPRAHPAHETETKDGGNDDKSDDTKEEKEDDKSGEAVLRALEAAAMPVDAKHVVQHTNVRLTSVTILYNPFAGKRITL